MEKLKEYLGTLIFIVVACTTIFGYWHVVKKHSDSELNLCMWVFPIATYHGVEYFWHNDYAGVDWNEWHQRDMKMINYFYLSYKGDSAKFQLMKDISSFHTEINKYPPEHLNYLKDGAKEYLLMNKSLTADIDTFVQRYFKGDTGAFIYSSSTSQHFANLKTKYFFDEDTAANGISKILHDRLRISQEKPLTDEELKNYMEVMRGNYEDGLFYQKKAYKDIFNEDYEKN